MIGTRLNLDRWRNINMEEEEKSDKRLMCIINKIKAGDGTSCTRCKPE